MAKPVASKRAGYHCQFPNCPNDASYNFAPRGQFRPNEKMEIWACPDHRSWGNKKWEAME